jgi:Flp pilus assembly protein TadD
LAVLDLMEKKYDEAAATFRRAYEADPANLKGLLGESEAYLMMGKPDQALSLIQDEVNKFPARNDLKRNLADVQFRTGHIDQAIQTYRDLMPLYKDNPKLLGDLYARIGDGYIRKKEFPSAIEQLRKAHELEPDSTQLINALALLLENSGNHGEARKLYQESISRKQDDPEALNNLAYLMAETGGNLDEALTLATRAKQKLPNILEISDTIGWIYLKKNLADSAVDIFKELTAKAPENPTYHYHYAMAFMQKGDRVNAKKQCEAALAAKPKDKEEEGHIRDLMSKT